MVEPGLLGRGGLTPLFAVLRHRLQRICIALINKEPQRGVQLSMSLLPQVRSPEPNGTPEESQAQARRAAGSDAATPKSLAAFNADSLSRRRQVVGVSS
jgi:hypothetical protein